jgi:hypothetical protein
VEFGVRVLASLLLDASSLISLAACDRFRWDCYRDLPISEGTGALSFFSEKKNLRKKFVGGVCGLTLDSRRLFSDVFFFAKCKLVFPPSL